MSSSGKQFGETAALSVLRYSPNLNVFFESATTLFDFAIAAVNTRVAGITEQSSTSLEDSAPISFVSSALQLGPSRRAIIFLRCSYYSYLHLYLSAVFVDTDMLALRWCVFAMVKHP